MSPITVVGAGAFGTALAIAFARGGAQVLLVARDAAAAGELQEHRENRRRLPGAALPELVSVSGNPDDRPAGGIAVLAVPAQANAPFAAAHRAALSRGPVVLAAKGIDLASGQLLSQVVGQALPGAPLAVLSGPGFADEIAAGLPTALTLAAPRDGLGEELQAALSTHALRLYRSTDMTGVQLGGALKNVVAIACGICSGAGLGESARAALMTRGFAEMVRLGQAMGARAESFQGLSGFGDLALTASSEKSRNYAAGRRIGQGQAIAGGVTVEGLDTARAAVTLARAQGVEMPVAAATVAVLDQKLSLREAMDALLRRPLRTEED